MTSFGFLPHLCVSGCSPFVGKPFVAFFLFPLFGRAKPKHKSSTVPSGGLPYFVGVFGLSFVSPFSPMEKESHFSGLLGGELVPETWCVEDVLTSPLGGGFLADLDPLGEGSDYGVL